MRQVIRTIIVLAAMTVTAGQTAWAGSGTTTVNKWTELKNAIADGAVIELSGDIVYFADESTISIDAGTVTIDGKGYIIDAMKLNSHIFEIYDGATLILKNLVLMDCFKSKVYNDGGTLIVDNCTFVNLGTDENNKTINPSVEKGAAIYNDKGTLKITNSVFNKNGKYDCSIYNYGTEDDPFSLTMINCTMTEDKVCVNYDGIEKRLIDRKDIDFLTTEAVTASIPALTYAGTAVPISVSGINEDYTGQVTVEIDSENTAVIDIANGEGSKSVTLDINKYTAKFINFISFTEEAFERVDSNPYLEIDFEVSPVGCASVTSGESTTNYESLDEAFAAANDGDVITMTRDYAVPVDAENGIYGLIYCNAGSSDEPVALDLNGHTLSFPDGGHLIVNLTRALTIRDSGTGGKITSAEGYAVFNTQTGILRLESGTLESTFTGDGNEQIKGAVYNQGTMYVAGGTVIGQKYGIYNEGPLWLSALPTFNCTVADISLAQDQKISFSGNITAAPEKKIKVKVANEAPYMFTDGYGWHVKNTTVGMLDPETVFEYYDAMAGLSFGLDENGSNGADVLIAQRYALSSENTLFFLRINDDLTPVEKAAEGQTIYVGLDDTKDIPEGQYFTGTFTSDEAQVGPVEDEGIGMPQGFGQFTMPVEAVTVAAQFAEQEEYTFDLTTATSAVVPDPVLSLLSYMKVGDKNCNVYADDGNWYLDLNVDGVNDLQVKDHLDETTQAVDYSIERLSGEGVYATNCHITLSTQVPERYKSLFFKFGEEVLYVTVSGLTAKDNIWTPDGIAEIDCSGAVFSGLAEGDELTISGVTGTYEGGNVDAIYDVTLDYSGATLGGRSADKYKLATDGNQSTTTIKISYTTGEPVDPSKKTIIGGKECHPLDDPKENVLDNSTNANIGVVDPGFLSYNEDGSIKAHQGTVITIYVDASAGSFFVFNYNGGSIGVLGSPKFAVPHTSRAASDTGSGSDSDEMEIVSGQEYVVLKDCVLEFILHTENSDITINKIVLRLPGDANCDDKVNAADLVEMINYKDNKPSAKFNLKNADTDGSGTITQSDIDAVEKIIMQK